VEGDTFHPSTANETQPYVITIDGTKVGEDDMDEAGTLVQLVTAKGLACGSHDVTVTELPPQSTGGDFAPSLPPGGRTRSERPDERRRAPHRELPAAGQPARPGQAWPNGTLATPCLISQHDRIGRRVLVGSDGSRSASAGALVISSSMQPSQRNDRFVIRR